MTRSEVNITWVEIGKHEILLIKCVFHKIWSSDFQKKAAFRFLKQNPLTKDFFLTNENSTECYYQKSFSIYLYLSIKEN